MMNKKPSGPPTPKKERSMEEIIRDVKQMEYDYGVLTRRKVSGYLTEKQKIKLEKITEILKRFKIIS